MRIFCTHTNLSKNILYPYTFHSAHAPGIEIERSLKLTKIRLSGHDLVLKIKRFDKLQ